MCSKLLNGPNCVLVSEEGSVVTPLTTRRSRSVISDQCVQSQTFAHKNTTRRGSSLRLAVSITKWHQSEHKKSLSLEDLSSSINQEMSAGRQLVYQAVDPAMEPAKDCGELDSSIRPVEKDLLRLAYKGYAAFVRNVWRKRRMKEAELRLEEHSLKEWVRSMDRQLVCMKHFMSKDGELQKSLVKEVHRLSVRIKDSERAKVSLLEEKNSLFARVSTLEAQLETAMTDLMCEKNIRITTDSEVREYEARLAKEREKITALRKENTELAEKLEKEKALCELKEKKIQDLSKTVSILEDQLTSRAHDIKCLEENLQKEITKLQKSESEVNSLRKKNSCLEETNTKLKENLLNMENLLEDATELKRKSEGKIEQQMVEIDHLRNKVKTYEAENWSRRLSRVASTFVCLSVGVAEAISFPLAHHRPLPLQEGLIS